MFKVIAGPIKVLQLIHSSGVTGPGRSVYSLAKNLDRKEFLTDVLAPRRGYLYDELTKIGVRILPLASKNIWNPRSIFSICSTLRKERYHVFHVHSGQLNVFSKIMGKLLGIPAIIFTEHLTADSHTWIKGKASLFIHLLFHRLSNTMIDRVISVSDMTRYSFIKRQKIDPRKISTIYPGLDLGELETLVTDASKIRQTWAIPQEAQIIGMVARLNPEKGHRIFILAAKEVLKRIPDVRFLIIGEGRERRNIEDLIEKLDLRRNFILTGLQDNIYKFIDIMDIFIQPSLAESESFGLSIIEAMARQRAVIASDIGCFREIIIDNENGLLFPAGDYFKLAEKIILLLNDRQLIKSIGISGQKTAANKFAIRIMIRKTQNLYKDVLLEKGFFLQRYYLRKIIAQFIENTKKERGLSLKELRTSCESIKRYLVFIKRKKLEYAEVKGYFAQHKDDNYSIEIFLEFLFKNNVFMDGICRYNNKLFANVLKKVPITLKDYDERIRMRPLQYQIDNYYEPKYRAQRERIDIILSYLKPKVKERILDVGCGVGTFAYYCAKKGAQAKGVDYSPASISAASLLTKRFGVSENVEFICCDAMKLPYPDLYFDKVVAADFIEHIDDAQKRETLLEMLRVLKPQGFIVVFTPNGLREWLGLIKAKLMKVSGVYQSETRLHYGLTNRFRFEKMLKGFNLIFKRKFFDVDKPYLAGVPILREILSLNILWIIKKRD